MEIIDAEAIVQKTAQAASAVDAVAAHVPSFSPTRQKLSGFGEPLRGRSPLYLVDEVPQARPLRDDSRDGYTFDPFFTDRVEVIFGSNAIQGVGASEPDLTRWPAVFLQGVSSRSGAATTASLNPQGQRVRSARVGGAEEPVAFDHDRLGAAHRHGGPNLMAARCQQTLDVR